MKVLLLNVPWYNGNLFGVRAGSRWPHIKIKEEGAYMPYPFFLGYSMSLLKKNDFKVSLIDALANKIKKNDFLILCKKEKPDFIFIESSITSLKNDLEYAKELKALTQAKIAFAGPLNHFYTKDFFEKHSYIDFAFIGEFEQTLLDVLSSLRDKKSLDNQKGLIINKGKDTNIDLTYNLIENLDSLPWPERKDICMDHYNDVPGEIPLPSAQIIASRGCPFGCSFCMWPQIMFKGKLHRVRSSKDVVDEMEYLVNELGFKSIYFDDDTFNIGKDRMIEICDEIIKRKISIPWAIMARADLMDYELLKKFKDAGLVALKYGVETADKDLMKKISKGLDLDKMKSIVGYTHELGIKSHLTFTFGIPGETWETVNKTIDLALELDPHTVQFSILTPFPETKLYDQLKKDNKILEDDFSKYDGNYGSVICTDALSKQDLENAIILAYAKWDAHKRNSQLDLVSELEEKNNIIDNFQRERQQHDHTNAELQRLITEIDLLDKTNKQTFTELEKHQGFLKEKNALLDEINVVNSKLNTDITILTDELSSFKKANLDLEKELDYFKKKLDKINPLLEQSKIKINALESSVERKAKDITQLSIEINKNISIIANQKEIIESLNTVKNSISDDLQKHIVDLKLMTDAYNFVDSKYTIINNLYQLIKKSKFYFLIKPLLRKSFRK